MDAKKNNMTGAVVAIYSIIAVLYAVVFLAVPFPKTASSWIMFVFTLIAIGASLGITWYAFKNDKGLKSKIYGFPIFRVGYLYVVAQFILGVIICLVSVFVAIPIWISLVLSILLMGITAIGVIAMDKTRDTIEEEEERVEIKTRTVKYFRLNISSIVALCNDETLRVAVAKLAEAFRFSDPVSSEETEPLERRLTTELEVLRALIEANAKDNALAEVTKISNLLAERNRVCKAYKK